MDNIFYLFFLGIGGFLVRARGVRGSGGSKDEEDPQAAIADQAAAPEQAAGQNGDPAKPKRRPARRKPKSRLMESYPSYLQVTDFNLKMN